MKDSGFKLQDKTVPLTGPFNGITQAIMRVMTEFGADVGYVSEMASNAPEGRTGPAAKYVDGINEGREINPKYGRAAFFNLPLDNDRDIQDALGTVVGALGRMDALVDATPLNWSSKTDPCVPRRSEEHTSELQSPDHLLSRLLLEKKKK